MSNENPIPPMGYSQAHDRFHYRQSDIYHHIGAFFWKIGKETWLPLSKWIFRYPSSKPKSKRWEKQSPIIKSCQGHWKENRQSGSCLSHCRMQDKRSTGHYLPLMKKKMIQKIPETPEAYVTVWHPPSQLLLIPDTPKTIINYFNNEYMVVVS